MTVNSGGALGGTGAISGWVAVTLGGHLAPGASIGTLNAGRVSMMENSIYEWELGATTADKVAVAGDLTLYNGWKVLLMNGGGAPRPGTEYDLFTYTGAAGLGTYTIDAGSTGWDVYDATIVNDAGGKRLYITGLALLGDTNSDGVVDAADYIALKQNFGLGSGATRAQGDFNHDNQVNWTDLQLLMSNFGTRSVGGVPATTPEPATLSLLALGGLAVIRRRRRVVGPHAAVVNQSPARGPSRFPTPNQISYQFVPLALEPS